MLTSKPCCFCNVEFTPKYVEQRFCSTRCSAKWRNSQPGIVESVAAKHRKPPRQRICEWCKNPFNVTWNKKTRNRFCCRSCSAAWRMTQPEIREKVYSPEVSAKRGRSKSAWFKSGTPEAAASLERIRSLNPMSNPGARAKISETMRRKGIRPVWSGGKGRGLTKPQQTLLSSLLERFGNVWEAEYPLPVSPRRRDLPSCFYLDIAHAGLKLAIEVDGGTHMLRSVQSADKRKEEYLKSQGWQILRFWNQQILDAIDDVIVSIVGQMEAR